jgi:CubicO group peptidase (beta-lactamase class C family)
VVKLRDALELMDRGVEEGVFPGGVVSIGNREGIIAEKQVGLRQITPEKKVMQNNTLFDLASLTKVVATTPLLIRLMEMGEISLYDLVADYLPDFQKDTNLRIIHLLTHTSGFEPFSALYETCGNFDEAIRYISESKRLFDVSKDTLYSDYNFILLKAIIEKITSEPFELSCERLVFAPLKMYQTVFNPKSDNVAATEADMKTGQVLEGVVHDENARFFGGVSGHAGLFSTARDLSNYCAMYLNEGKLDDGSVFFCEKTIECMRHNYTEGLGESRGLGFCIKKHGENCSGGELISEGSFGHTGFTGTSIWIDPEIGIFIVLLTNRVHPTRDNNKIIQFRRIFHNTVIAAISGGERAIAVR